MSLCPGQCFGIRKFVVIIWINILYSIDGRTFRLEILVVQKIYAISCSTTGRQLKTAPRAARPPAALSSGSGQDAAWMMEWAVADHHRSKLLLPYQFCTSSRPSFRRQLLTADWPRNLGGYRGLGKVSLPAGTLPKRPPGPPPTPLGNQSIGGGPDIVIRVAAFTGHPIHPSL